MNMMVTGVNDSIGAGMHTGSRVDGPGHKGASTLSGEVFGVLINLSGRRRFASQRIVLYALLAAQGDSAAVTIARDALQLFTDAHATLLHGNDQLPGIFCDALHDAYYGKAQGQRQIQAFIELATRCLDAIDSGDRHADRLLAELVRTPTSILATLNQITAIYEEEARRHAQRMKTQLRGVIADIEHFAREAKMVALNARIVAARAGDAGREFSVVAQVLGNLTAEIEGKVGDALENT